MKDTNNVFEFEVVKINEKYSAITITHQDERVFPRGKFFDDELMIASNTVPGMSTQCFLIRGTNMKFDLHPIVGPHDFIEYIVQRLRLLNNKYSKGLDLVLFLEEKLKSKKFKRLRKNYYIEYLGDGKWECSITFLKKQGWYYWEKEGLADVVDKINELKLDRKELSKLFGKSKELKEFREGVLKF